MPTFKPIEIKGLKEALRKLHGMPDNIKRHVGRGLKFTLEMVMTDSKQNYVPVDDGTLRGSGFVEQPKIFGDVISIALGFGGPAAPYAFAVHENPRSGKTGGFSPSGPRETIFRKTITTPKGKVLRAEQYGIKAFPIGGQRKTWAKVGQWKYLETPLLAATPRIKAVIAAAPGQAFERG